ncbi:MAG: hypothetical protein KIT31_35565 [Deltaproteobacteria bacterium]|nr:hypothetical protein [Deltaproteobacteria bacterium]
MQKRVAAVLIATLAACGGEDREPPFAEVPGQIGSLAVNDTSLFGIDAMGGIVEINLADAAIVGMLPTLAAAKEIVAAADWVAWIEPEGTGNVVRRRRGDGTVESTRTFEPHLAARATGLFFSDLQLVAKWNDDGVIERVATPGLNPRVLDVDATYAYTVEGDTSVVRYMVGTDQGEVLLPTSMGASIKDEQLAYRTGEGIRLRNLFTSFDRVVGTPPASVMCNLVIAGSAVMCGKYRALEGVVDELLSDPVNGAVAVGKDLYWVTLDGDTSQIYKTDAELVDKDE